MFIICTFSNNSLGWGGVLKVGRQYQQENNKRHGDGGVAGAGNAWWWWAVENWVWGKWISDVKSSVG